jgi:hypothetical protein
MEEKYRKNVDVDSLIVEEILVFHQEKRTALRMVRIGISSIIAQITILGFLIATSKYYKWVEVMHLWIPFVVLNLVVLGIAGYFIFGSLIHIHRLDRQIHRYKKSHGVIADSMD